MSCNKVAENVQSQIFGDASQSHLGSLGEDALVQSHRVLPTLVSSVSKPQRRGVTCGYPPWARNVQTQKPQFGDSRTQISRV